MNKTTSIHHVDLVFRAFSDRTRLRILNLLRAGELCVCDLIRVLNLPQAKVSRHLGYLKKAGLVAVRKEKLWSYYSLAPVKDTFHGKMMECLACCFADVAELARDSRKLAKSPCGPGCCQ